MTTAPPGSLIEKTYDEVPYPSIPKPETHPERLATLATLFGMRPAPVDHCRVLELGCADGGNIIPMAEAFRDSEFVGIDLGARQLAEGQAVVQRLGLRNITLAHQNILDFTCAEPFDYIITYGIFSWVPREVQEKILEISSHCLAPHGVAYVSYNVYPGWHMRRMVREMMLYHTRDMQGLAARAQESRTLLNFLAEASETLSGRVKTTLDLNAYSASLRREQDVLATRPDVYLVHEFLEEVNDPIYFHEFVERAASHGLRFLAESEYSTMHTANFATQTAEQLRRLGGGDLIRTEQYMDFVRDRTFRQTLLCHSEIELERGIQPDVLRKFYISSNVKPVSESPDIHGDGVEKFRGANGTVLTAGTPLAKAAMLYLSETWPQPLPFAALLDRARRMVDSNASPVQGSATRERELRSLGEMLLRCFALDIVELFVRAPNYVLQAGERPLASPLARLQAERKNRVTGRRHEEITLDDEVSYHLLRLLDGSRDRRALLEALSSLVADGVLTVQADGQPLRDPVQEQRLLQDALARNLDRLARAGLLIG